MISLMSTVFKTHGFTLLIVAIIVVALLFLVGESACHSHQRKAEFHTSPRERLSPYEDSGLYCTDEAPLARHRFKIKGARRER